MLKQKSLYIILFYIVSAIVIAVSIGAWAFVSVRRRAALQPVHDGWVVEANDFEFPTVMLRTGFSGTEIKLDDEIIYRSDLGREEHGRLSGTRSLFLVLPDDSEGKPLHIVSSPGYDAPLFGEYTALSQLYILEVMPAVAAGSFLLLFGIVFLFLTTGFSVTGSDTAEHIFGALISIDLGIWLLCSYGLGSYFLRDPYSAAVERASLILIFPLVLFLLYFLKDDHVLRKGIALFVACSIVYIGILFAGVILSLEIDRVATIWQVLGCVMFVLAQILNYYLNISASYIRQKEYESLSEKAYVDALTGLPNRKRAQDVFRGLNAAMGSYSIVSLDLDNLKQINDRFGHHAGDEMLIQTASILNTCFGEKGFRARMGGDEFVVVLKKVSKDALDGMIMETNRHLRRAGQQAHGIDYSISAGYAYKEECDSGTSEDVFKLADERMYRHKAMKKSGYN